MGGTCGTYEEEQKCMHSFGGENLKVIEINTEVRTPQLLYYFNMFRPLVSLYQGVEHKRARGNTILQTQ